MSEFVNCGCLYFVLISHATLVISYITSKFLSLFVKEIMSQKEPEVAISLHEAAVQHVHSHRRRSSQFKVKKRGQPTKKRQSQHNIFVDKDVFSPTLSPGSPDSFTTSPYDLNKKLGVPIPAQSITRSYSLGGTHTKYIITLLPSRAYIAIGNNICNRR